jgi:hypothetical protein
VLWIKILGLKKGRMVNIVVKVDGRTGNKSTINWR